MIKTRSTFTGPTLNSGMESTQDCQRCETGCPLGVKLVKVWMAGQGVPDHDPPRLRRRLLPHPPEPGKVFQA